MMRAEVQVADKVRGIIDVDHECDGQWHEFTSPQVPGLYVVTEDLEAAFEDIPRAIEQLILADYGIQVVVQQQETFEQYFESLPETHRTSRYHYAIERKAA